MGISTRELAAKSGAHEVLIGMSTMYKYILDNCDR